MERNINKYTEEYIKPQFEHYLVEYRRQQVINFMRTNNSKRILEIGCGMEPLFMYYNDYEYFCIVEPSDVFAANAREKAPKNKNVFVVNDFFTSGLKLPVDEFDCIVCSSLLHEIENPGEMLDAIVSKCLADTIVHINVPNANSFHRLLAVKAGLIADSKEFSSRNIKYMQHSVFDIKDIETLTNQHGLAIVESGTYFIKPFTHGQMYKMLESEIITPKILDGLNEMVKYMPDLGAELFVNCKKADK